MFMNLGDIDSHDHDAEVFGDDEILLPNQWFPRHYQFDLMQYMFTDGIEGKRAVCVWHRRAGKDSTCLNLAAVMTQVRVGTIWHMLPTLQQGRRVIWDGIDKDGRRMIDQAFPKSMRVGTNNSEMKISLKNGSIWQVVGSDNYDSLVGTNPVGVIFSEYSISDPSAWDYIRPILVENGGWAMFIYTPRGKNHGFNLFNMAKGNPKWYSSELTINDTFNRGADGETDAPFTGRHIIDPEMIEEERAAGMADEKILQEFFCSWNTGLEGAFYTDALNKCGDDGRIGDNFYDPSKPVFTFWDIGLRDNTAVIFVQRSDAGQPIIIDYKTERNKSLAWWIKTLKELDYVYESHTGPHDMAQREFSTGKSRLDFAADLGFHFEICANLPVADGIDASRALLAVSRFNKKTTEPLLDSLYSYCRDYDDKTKLFKDKPSHTWASHGADAFRYLSISWRTVGSNVGWGVKRSDNYRKQHKVKRAMR